MSSIFRGLTKHEGMTALTPSRIIWALAGEPVAEGCQPVDVLCRMCAKPTTLAQVFDRWQGSSFTDQNKVKCTSSLHICAACIWAHSWVQPPGMEPAPPGKKGVCLRLFSHFHDARGYRYWNKANKAEIRDWLRAPKSGEWFAAIADSGQKHVLPYTQMNPAGTRRGLVRFEERDVVLGDWARLDEMTELLNDGVTKEAIESGEFTSQHWQDSESLIRAFEGRHGRDRGSGWFGLCLWLAQRDEHIWKERMDERKRERAARKADGGGAARDEKSVPRGRRKSAKALGSTARQGADGFEVYGVRRGVGDGDKPQAQPGESDQLSLFGD